VKKVGSKRYLHRTALAELSAKDRERVQAVSAEVPGFKWSVVRLDGSQIMLGRTTSFETDPHPALLESITFESGLQTNRKRYGTNPPIYHRIELMLPQGHPARRKAASRTKCQQAKGLLSRPDIGTRRSWRRAKGSSNSLNQTRVGEDVEMRNCRTIVDQFLYRACVDRKLDGLISDEMIEDIEEKVRTIEGILVQLSSRGVAEDDEIFIEVASELSEARDELKDARSMLEAQPGPTQQGDDVSQQGDDVWIQERDAAPSPQTRRAQEIADQMMNRAGIKKGAEVIAQLAPKLPFGVVWTVIDPNTGMPFYSVNSPTRLGATLVLFKQLLDKHGGRIKPGSLDPGKLDRVVLRPARIVPCPLPHCNAGAGSDCLRPSGHPLMYGKLHAARVEAFDRYLVKMDAKLGYTRKRRGSRGQYTEQFADLIRSGDGGMDYAEELARAAGVPLDLSGADLSGISLTHVKLIAINLSGADLSGSTLYSSTLIASDLTGANLTDTNLRMAKLSRADLSGANLSDAHLSGAWLLRSNLSGADLSGADLIGAKMKGINLTGANLTGANLNGADLSGADLTDAVLTDAWLIRIRYNLETKWPKGFTPPPSTWS
jgi:uncharacterized protein YjbI with pentapeptide repeats